MPRLNTKMIRVQLEGRVAKLTGAPLSAADSTGLLPDINDEASREAERSFTAELATRRRNELLRVKMALTRLEEGTYGVCESCDQSINPRRLEVNPTALYCAGCQQELEQERRTDLRASA